MQNKVSSRMASHSECHSASLGAHKYTLQFQISLVYLRKRFLRMRIYYCLKFSNRDSHPANERTEGTSKFRTCKKINNKLRQKRSFNATVAIVNLLENI